MNCYDCNARDRSTSAVAICNSCGAGVCGEHACSRPRQLHRCAGTGVSALPIAARRILCPTCNTAEHRS
ncbi:MULTISPECIES: DUF2180 family protein [Streptomyces]